MGVLGGADLGSRGDPRVEVDRVVDDGTAQLVVPGAGAGDAQFFERRFAEADVGGGIRCAQVLLAAM